MSIFLLLRVYALSFFQRFGWAGLAIALGIHLSTAWLGLVRTHSDDLPLATVLAVNLLNPAGHVVAHFNESEIAALASSNAPSLECTSSMAIEMLARASQDPGSSVVINELLCVGQGATQYLMKLPHNHVATFGDLYAQMKERHNATLIGYRAKGAQQPSFNPPGATCIEGDELFHIVSTRLKEISNGMV